MVLIADGLDGFGRLIFRAGPERQSQGFVVCRAIECEEKRTWLKEMGISRKKEGDQERNVTEISQVADSATRVAMGVARW